MTVFILTLLISASACYIVTLLNQINQVSNQYGLRIAGLEQELHEALEAVGHYHNPVAVANPNSESGIALAAMILRKEQQIVDPSQHSGRIILDDTYDVNIVHDKELDDRLRSSIARRMGVDTPLVIIQSRVHEEDCIGVSAEELDAQVFDYDWLTTPLDDELDLSYLLPTHIRGTHPYSFRTGEWARIVGIEIRNLRSGPRHVFKAVYDDDAKDTVAICDSANYEFK